MGDWVVGLSTGSFFRQPIFNVLEAIYRSGFRVIEISASIQHLDYHSSRDVREASRMIKRVGLHPLSFHAPFGTHIDITSLSAREREDSVQEILASIKAASVLGVRHMIVHPGPDKEKTMDGDHAERLRNGIGSLRRILVQCNDVRAGLVLENMLPHLAVGQASDVMTMIKALHPNQVGACLDTGHAYIGGNLIGDLLEMANHIVFVHANDNRGQKDDHLPPGKGKIDWIQFLAALKKVGYKGPLMLELNGGGTQLEQTLAGGKEALRLIQGLS
jgi:sugar phosphate isomerase/epimerase